MLKNLLLTSLKMLTIVSTIATAQVASPPRSASEGTKAVQPWIEPPAGTVTAILVKSWGDNPVWADLNANWSTYGTVPVSIDYTTLIGSDFTYQDLVNSNANVIILSDPAGGLQQYSSTEVAALAQYVKAGHVILGTYLTFQYQAQNIDNRALAPIFGLSSSMAYDFVGISNQFTRVGSACLFNKIRKSWQSLGYPNSQVPTAGSWLGNLGKERAGAESDNYVGVIGGIRGGTAAAIYISNMPEFSTIGGNDEQLLYNAITCYAQ